MPPRATSPSIMLIIGIMPPSAVYESCIELTAPVEVSVDADPNSVEAMMPKRCSLPSIAPPAAIGAVPWPFSSKIVSAVKETTKIVAMTATIAVPWRVSPTIFPKVRGSENGIASIRITWNALVQAVGSSNGCAEFALKNPPPFVPSILMASCEATGPPGIVCVPPVMVATSWKPAKFWITPPAMRITAVTSERGSSRRRDPRIRSTQRLPIVPVRVRAKPRTSAMATAMPTAAETKFCTASPASWTV